MPSILCHMNQGVTVRSDIHQRFQGVLKRVDSRLAEEDERLARLGALAADQDSDDAMIDFDDGSAPEFSEPDVTAPAVRRCRLTTCKKRLAPVSARYRGRKPQYCDKLCRDRALRERKA